MVSEWNLYYKVKKKKKKGGGGNEWERYPLTKRVDSQPSWNCLDTACHPIESFWCVENRMVEKNISWLDAEPWAYFEDSRVHLNFFLYLHACACVSVWRRCVSSVCAGADTYSHAACTFTLGLCESFRIEKGGGGGIMSASVFPSVTMKDVDWGHIEHRCSRNIKGPPSFIQWCSVCLQYVLTCIHIAARQLPIPMGRLYGLCVCLCVNLTCTVR